MAAGLSWGAAAESRAEDFFSKPEEAAPAEINEALGVKLFGDAPFWEEAEGAVAERLGWPEESRTREIASYRRYGKADGASEILGATAFSAAFYAENGKPAEVSVVFANKGDAASPQALKEAMARDEAAIVEKLNAVFGEARRESFGKRDMRERVQRWDWKGGSFLLSVRDGEYIGLRFVPAEVADRAGMREIISDAEMEEILKKRIVKREQGDVVVTELPMIDQGPKGYCVPATWERYLRYLKMPADMYVLAMVGGTGFGAAGGTSLGALDESVDRLAQSYKRRVKQVGREVKVKDVARYIDKGLPIMWSCTINEAFEKDLTARSQARREMKGPREWAESLKAARKEAAAAAGGPSDGHLRMIIGYNAETDEIAVSDSWGGWAAERWMTVEEAQAISRGYLCVIQY